MSVSGGGASPAADAIPGGDFRRPQGTCCCYLI